MTGPTQRRAALSARRAQTIEALTAAVHLEADIGDFLGSVLAATAANAGGVEQVLAGRPGSWEADLVRQLINGTVPDTVQALAWHRTAPVVVPLNVHDLLSDAAGGTTEYHRAVDAAEAIWQAQEFEGCTQTDDDGCPTCAAYEDQLDVLRTVWTQRYEQYARAFEAAVTAEAARIEGLTVPVTVQANSLVDATMTDPANPDEFDSDPFVWRLWSAARSAVPAPTDAAG